MRTVLFPGDRKIEIVETTKPKPGFGQVLIEMKAAGLCGSDLHQQYRVPASQRKGIVVGHRTDPCTIPGHEPAGVVASLGEGVSNLSIGDRVAVAHVTGCGHCQACRRGRDIDCKNKVFYGLDRDGALSDFMVAEAKDCVKLPDQISFVEGAIWACGAGTAYAALERGGLVAGQTVAVVGLGPVGAAACFFAQKAGARVIGIDPIEARREHAKSLGADHTFDAMKHPDELTRALTRGEGADLVIEASGVSPGRASTVSLARVGGTIVFVGLNDALVEFDIDQVIQKQLNLKGCWVFGTPDLQEMINHAVDTGISVEEMVTYRYSLEDAETAITNFDKGSLGKTVFVWP
ncbi:zinc-binding dehydrogenase [Agrobacterium sp. MS2]|uniref:zinc-binding dehydrogenase n=1 Tax=Agrobacterium sp. MS2 TaxID=1345498 RepID=UPI000DBFD8EF|nr:zinc-binding dehydrogenase [Agrobacterium sp. MS2]RAL96033.1 alcohol dehydrogenase [Agrobacterium sp. MS2]